MHVFLVNSLIVDTLGGGGGGASGIPAYSRIKALFMTHLIFQLFPHDSGSILFRMIFFVFLTEPSLCLSVRCTS